MNTEFTNTELEWLSHGAPVVWLSRPAADIELELGLVTAEPSNDTDLEAEVWTINLEQAS